MKNFTIICSLFFFFALTADAQSFKKSTRLGLTFYPQPESMVETPAEVNEGYVVPNIFIESERRFLKFFTIGTETNFAWYKMTADQYDFEMNAYNMRFELQGKVSIPIFNFLEAYGQYGLGYSGVWYHSNYASLDQDVYVDYATKTLSLGVSVFLFDGFGLFAEAGQISHRSFRTMGEVLESTHAANINNPIMDKHIEHQSAYLKLGLVFSIH